MADSKRRVWELWSLGQGGRYRYEPVFVEAFYDKGQARERVRRLRRSHSHIRYELRSRSLSTYRRGYVPFERRR